MKRRNPSKSYDIVLRSDPDAAPISLESVSDANEATLAFHIQMQRLACEGTTGELVLLNRIGNDRRLGESPVLRLRIG